VVEEDEEVLPVVAAAASLRGAVASAGLLCRGSSGLCCRLKRGALKGLARASWVRAVGYMVSCLPAAGRCTTINRNQASAVDRRDTHTPASTLS